MKQAEEKLKSKESSESTEKGPFAGYTKMEGDCVRFDGSRVSEDYVSNDAGSEVMCVDNCKTNSHCFGFHF